MKSTLKSLLLGTFLAAGLAPVFPTPPLARAADPRGEAAREIEILVDAGAYAPSRITVKAGERVRLKVVRREYNACTKELLIPSLGIRRELPPGKPVVLELPPLEPGEHEFRCGMNMARGTIVVSAL